jgi:arylsulfatase A-like enzyme
MRRLVALTVVALAVAAAGSVVWRPSPTPPRLVLLYAPCTVNKKFLSPYNPAVRFTPSLDELSRDAVVFTRQQTEEGQSGIAYASLFSGLQADGHGVFVHPARLNDAVYLVTEAFADHGYDAFFWGQHSMASPWLNYAQGVASENVYAHKALAKPEERQEGILRGNDAHFLRILRRLQTDPSYKAFVVAIFTVTHQPYVRSSVPAFCARYPDECRNLSNEQIAKYAKLFVLNFSKLSYAFEHTVASLALSEEDVANLIAVAELLYKANVARLDDMFGDVMQTIRAHGLLDQTLVAFTSDHGEMLYRSTAPYQWSHGFALAPEDIEVPLIIRSPGVPAGRYEGVTRSIDVFPTLAGLAGISTAAKRTAGVDLSPALRGKTAAPRLLAFSHTSLIPPTMKKITALATRFPDGDARAMWVAVRDGDLVVKLTSDDGILFHPRAYDWHADPAERVDLYDPANEAHAHAVQQLSKYKTALIDSYSEWRAHKAGRLPTRQQEELLRSLGYGE